MVVSWLCLLAVLLLLAPAALAADHPSDRFGEHTPVMVVMDVSDSMSQLNGTDGRRIDAARSAMLDLVGALDPGHAYGLISYPGGSTDDSGCTVGQVQTPVGALDSVAASSDIRRLSPHGDTPTGPALRHARDAIEAAGYSTGTIVLVSDGESNCGPDPCEVASQIWSSGYEVVINTVGFEVEDTAAEELQCVAKATNGRYFSVEDRDHLAAGIAAASGAHVTVGVGAPTELDVVTGVGTSGTAFDVTVTSDGRFPAHDVRVTLSVDDGAILVPRPVRFLGNLVPGSSRTVRISARPDEMRTDVSWKVTVAAENAAPVVRTGAVSIDRGLARSDLGPLLADVERVAVVGDSYSSGEGIGVYRASSTNKCHRADAAMYAAQIWGDERTDLIACSGAVTADFFSQQRSGQESVVPQLLSLRSLAVGPDSPEAVFLSIGGNDAGFGDVIKDCVDGGQLSRFGKGPFVLPHRCGILSHDANDEPVFASTAMLDAAMAVGPDVHRVLRAIDAAVNDEVALERRDGEVAPVVVMPYPQITPDTGTQIEGCMALISESEIADLNAYLAALNSTISLAAYELRNQGRPVYVATDVEEAFLPDHTICEQGKSWAVTDSFDELGGAGRLNVLTDPNELLHPNRRGHQAMARALIAWSHGRAAREFEVSDPPTWDLAARQVEVPGPFQRAADWVLDVATPRVAEVGGSHPVNLSDFSSGSHVVVRIESSPTTLGVVHVDDDNSARIGIPNWIPAGRHHVRVSGPGDKGLIVTKTVPVDVQPRGTAMWILLGGLGLLCLLVATLTQVRNRWRDDR